MSEIDLYCGLCQNFTTDNKAGVPFDGKINPNVNGYCLAINQEGAHVLEKSILMPISILRKRKGLNGKMPVWASSVCKVCLREGKMAFIKSKKVMVIGQAKGESY